MKWHPSTLQTTLALLLLLFFNTSVVADTKHRVISLSPANTELAYAAGLGESLIAVSAYSDYPAEAKQLEQVSDWQGLNVERIVALKPDLILAWRGGNPQRPLTNLLLWGSLLSISIHKALKGLFLLSNNWLNTARSPKLPSSPFYRCVSNLTS